MRTPTIVNPGMLKAIANVFPSTIRIEEPVVTRSSSGEVITDWQTVTGLDAIPAARGRVRSLEIRTPELTEAEARHRWMLAGYFPQITAAMRLVDEDGNAWDITAVDSDAARVVTVVDVRDVAPEAVTGQ
jgi:head-tail adaptor